MKRAGLPPIHNSRSADNRPVRWVKGDEVVEMAFDRMGRRVAKNSQRFVYDGYLQIADNAGNAYVWDATENVATRPLVWNRGGTSAYYAHDGNKNVSDVIASNGDVVAHYDYAPFGAVIAQSGALASANPWRFSSEYADCDLGLVYYNYRHYDPVTGRWTSRDPIEVAFDDGYEPLYVFVNNLVADAFDELGEKRNPGNKPRPPYHPPQGGGKGSGAGSYEGPSVPSDGSLADAWSQAASNTYASPSAARGAGLRFCPGLKDTPSSTTTIGPPSCKCCIVTLLRDISYGDPLFYLIGASVVNMTCADAKKAGTLKPRSGNGRYYWEEYYPVN